MKPVPLMKIRYRMSRSVSFLLLVVAALSGMATSCKDKNKKAYCEENPSQCQSVLAAKDFFLFKVGSWWVYEEETSHERDSMYVTHYNNPATYDFDMYVKSARTNYEYHYFPFYAGGNPNCSQAAPVAGKCIYIKRSKSKPGDFVGEGNCFFVNYKKGEWTYVPNVTFDNNTIKIEDVHSSYNLGELSFGETVKVRELKNFIEGNQRTNHFFSRDIGLIRMELIDSNKVWNLVSYHIEE